MIRTPHFRVESAHSPVKFGVRRDYERRTKPARKGHRVGAGTSRRAEYFSSILPTGDSDKHTSGCALGIRGGSPRAAYSFPLLCFLAIRRRVCPQRPSGKATKPSSGDQSRGSSGWREEINWALKTTIEKRRRLARRRLQFRPGPQSNRNIWCDTRSILL